MTFMKCERCGSDLDIVETAYCEGCHEEEESCTCPKAVVSTYKPKE